MKRAIIITVIVAMFGWAVYDFVLKSDNKTTQDEGEGEIPIGLQKGMMAPNFTLETSDGEEVKLSDFRGERVLLNFWATWCPPCRAEMPDMQRFYEEKDIVILAVNLTETRNEVKDVYPFLEEYGITFPVLLDKKSEVSFLYQIQPIPTNFLINSDGTIHNVAYGALNYGSMIGEFDRMN